MENVPKHLPGNLYFVTFYLQRILPVRVANEPTLGPTGYQHHGPGPLLPRVTKYTVSYLDTYMYMYLLTDTCGLLTCNFVRLKKGNQIPLYMYWKMY